MYFRSFLIFCVLTGTPLLAQQKAAEVSGNEEPVSSFQAVDASIYAILQQYQQLTGNTLIMDSNLSVNALPISISVPEPVPRSELVRIIESALLLNNYALIPGPGPKTVKVINMNAGKKSAKRGSSTLHKSGLVFPKVSLQICSAPRALPAAHFDRNESHVIYGTGR
jgi:type II secretory pathway component GspD/PulD (secretin)